MLGFIINAIKIIFLLGLLVFIHEGGHFVVAKLCKIRVNEFALGFGPTIFKFQGKETKYALRLIPLGGFVSMEGEEERSLKEGSFSKASIFKRIIIVAAGGLVNIIFGLIIYFTIATTSFNYSTNKVASVIEGYNAQIVGINQGDEILKIDGKRIITSEDINKVLLKTKNEKIKVVLKRNGKQIEYEMYPNEIKYKDVGIYLREGSSTKIFDVAQGSMAQKQGLKANDLIIKINGEDVKDNANKLLEIINKTTSEDLKFLVLRHNKELEINVTPEEKSSYYLGVSLEKAEDNFINRIYYSFYDTINFGLSLIDNLKELFTGKVSTYQVMGPVRNI